MEKDVINILIVDDEKYEGILMEKSVAWESEGFHIMGNVQCAEDALALMEKQTPDIVYTDINMPENRWTGTEQAHPGDISGSAYCDRYRIPGVRICQRSHTHRSGRISVKTYPVR